MLGTHEKQGHGHWQQSDKLSKHRVGEILHSKTTLPYTSRTDLESWCTTHGSQVHGGDRHSVKFARPAPNLQRASRMYAHEEQLLSTFCEHTVPGHYRRLTRKIHNNFQMTNIFVYLVYNFFPIRLLDYIHEKSQKGIFFSPSLRMVCFHIHYLHQPVYTGALSAQLRTIPSSLRLFLSIYTIRRHRVPWMVNTNS